MIRKYSIIDMEVSAVAELIECGSFPVEHTLRHGYMISVESRDHGIVRVEEVDRFVEVIEPEIEVDYSA